MKIFVAVVSIVFFSLTTLAQKVTPYLEKKVTIQVTNANAEDVLKSIERQGDFTFSYGPQVLEGVKPVTIQSKTQPGREVLNQIFQGQVTYKQKGNHVILVRTAKVDERTEPLYYLITGYIVDGKSGNQVSEVSVFEKKTRESAVTNLYGYFTLKIDRKDVGEPVLLNINKANFKDTIYYVKQAGNTHINVTIYPLPANDSTKEAIVNHDSLMRVDQMAFVNMLISNEEAVHTRNINDTIYRDFQASFIPFIGSNMQLSGVTVNDFSLNILGGYSMGTRKLEVGGLFNIDRDTAKYVQIGGLFNVVGKHTEGAQVAGLLNLNQGTVEGAEVAGLVNLNNDSVKGAELAGLINFNKESVSGFQGAGLLNVNMKESNSAEVAGLMNFSLHRTNGVQIAGLLNVCGKEISGTQISGLINFATKVHGTQIGVFNFADSVSGVPVGFLSFVRSGYHQLEISANETFPLNVALRTGVRSFYNILEAGMRFETDIPVWHFGYGVGTAANLGNKWLLDVDLTMSQPLKGDELNYFNPLTKLNLTIEKRFSKYFTLAAGPSLNLFAANLSDPTFNSILTQIPPAHVMYSEVHGDYQYTSWIGAKIALRFF